jgi:hypothetical protein
LLLVFPPGAPLDLTRGGYHRRLTRGAKSSRRFAVTLRVWRVSVDDP